MFGGGIVCFDLRIKHRAVSSECPRTGMFRQKRLFSPSSSCFTVSDFPSLPLQVEASMLLTSHSEYTMAPAGLRPSFNGVGRAGHVWGAFSGGHSESLLVTNWLTSTAHTIPEACFFSLVKWKVIPCLAGFPVRNQGGSIIYWCLSHCNQCDIHSSPWVSCRPLHSQNGMKGIGSETFTCLGHTQRILECMAVRDATL